MHVESALAGAGVAVGAEQGFELLEEVGLGAEVARRALALALGLRDGLLHPLAVVPVEAVALDDRRADVLAVEDVLERALDGGGAGAAGTGDGDDGVLD